MNPSMSIAARLYVGAAANVILIATAATLWLTDTVGPAWAAALLGVAALVSVGAAVWALRALGARLAAASALAQQVARGDLSAPAQTAHDNDDIGRLMASLHRMLVQLRRLMGDMRDAAGSIDTASAEIASGNRRDVGVDVMQIRSFRRSGQPTRARALSNAGF